MNKHYARWYALLAAIILMSGSWPILFAGASAGLLVATVVVAIAAPPLIIGLLARTGYPIGRAVSCPTCGNEMPFFRMPANRRMALFGGYKCTRCGTETDARGRFTAT